MEQGLGFQPQNCLYVNQRKSFRYGCVNDIQIKVLKGDSSAIPKHKFFISKFNEKDKFKSYEIEKYPKTASFMNFYFDCTQDTIVNIAFTSGLGLNYLDSNYNLIKYYPLDLKYEFGTFLNANKFNNNLYILYDQALLTYNVCNNKVNKLILKDKLIESKYFYKPILINNELNFLYVKNDIFGIFNYKNNKISYEINKLFNEKIVQLKLVNQINSELFFLVKLSKSRWKIVRLEV